MQFRSIFLHTLQRFNMDPTGHGEDHVRRRSSDVPAAWQTVQQKRAQVDYTSCTTRTLYQRWH
jgi:hypothetical protein